jgi:hypothetical protein
MEFIVPEILAELRQMSAVFAVTGMLVGCVLWLAGWWSHRFWVVMAFTVFGGVWGLQHCETLHAQPLVAALGVAVGAGILALTLVRLVAFVAGGYVGLLLLHAISPSWDQPLLSFLAGGMLGYFLFRFWTMALTSTAGVLLMSHSILALADQLGKFDAVAWVEANHSLANGICAALAVGGFLTQFGSQWWFARKVGGKSDKKAAKKDKKEGGSESSLAAFRRAG